MHGCHILKASTWTIGVVQYTRRTHQLAHLLPLQSVFCELCCFVPWFHTRYSRSLQHRSLYLYLPEQNDLQEFTRKPHWIASFTKSDRVLVGQIKSDYGLNAQFCEHDWLGDRNTNYMYCKPWSAWPRCYDFVIVGVMVTSPAPTCKDYRVSWKITVTC